MVLVGSACVCCFTDRDNISAPAEVLAKFREDIKQFDVPAAQIMIDVVMVEFTDSAAKELDFDLLWSNVGKQTPAQAI